MYAYFDLLNLRANALDGLLLGIRVIIGGHGFDPPVVLVGRMLGGVTLYTKGSKRPLEDGLDWAPTTLRPSQSCHRT
jgi:hypothetical protein